MNSYDTNPAKPEKNIKVGAVRAAIWKYDHQTRDGRPFESRKVVLDRSYKDRQGQWKNTNSFGLYDIPKAILALQKAYELILGVACDTANDGVIEEEVV